MSDLKINGIDMPAFQSMSVVLSDVDSDSKRNEMGILQRDRIRAGARKLSINWPPLLQEDTVVILAALEPAQFTVTYTDPASAEPTTRFMYAGDKSINAINTKDGIRWNISVDLIEY